MPALVISLPRLITVLCLPLFVSCDADTEGRNVIPTGIFEVTEQRINASGCNAPGEPYAGPNPLALIVLFADRILDDPVYRVMNCGDRDDCALLREAVLSTESGPVPNLNLTFFGAGHRGARLTQSSTGFATGTGLCEEPTEIVAELSFASEDVLSLLIEETVGPDYESDDAGFCSIEAGQAALRDVPCTSAVFISATRLE